MSGREGEREREKCIKGVRESLGENIKCRGLRNDCWKDT